MTPIQRDQIAALRRCPLVPAPELRFLRGLLRRPESAPLGVASSRSLNRLAHEFRQQIGRCLAAPCKRCGNPEPSAADRVQLGAQLEIGATK